MQQIDRVAIVEAALDEAGHGRVEVLTITPLAGGCINAANLIETNAGRFLLKTNPNAPDDLFLRESEGLHALRQSGHLRVPEPIAVGIGGETVPYLLTEYIEHGQMDFDYFYKLGISLAEHHHAQKAERFGFKTDNYIGSTSQENTWEDDWLTFFREHRLEPQFRLASQNGYVGELQRLGLRMLDRLDHYLDDHDEAPVLIHGDLWSGNHFCSADGEPVLIDPAVCYGSREADLAMTKLFGGFSARFYSAYEEVWPLEVGAEARMDIYNLYHRLIHLNLFGGSYLGGCLETLRRYV